MKPLLLACLMLCAGVSHSQTYCGFSHKRIITINGGQITGGPHTDFPVLISHTDVQLADIANGGNVSNSNGFDITFFNDNGTQLDHQIEKYVNTTGEVAIWVKIPSLTNGTDYNIHMMYGNATIVADQSTTNTWDTDFTGVWHMSEDPSGTAPQILDYLGSNDGTSNGTMTNTDLVAGKCGDGIDFDGSNDYIDIGDVLIDGTTRITIEAWINPTSLPTKASPSGHNSNEGAIVHKSGGSDDNLGITVASGGMAYYIDDGGNNTTVGTAPSTSTWMHVVATWDNSTMTIYQNGVSNSTLASVTGTFVNNTNSLRFGGGHIPAGSPHEFTGIIDEIRISDVARSANWIATSYNSQNQPISAFPAATAGDFYAVTGEIDLTPTSAADGNWDATATWGVASVNEVPGLGSVIDIRHDVALGATDTDKSGICSCDISNAGSNSGALDVSGGRVITIDNDLTLTANNNANFVQLDISGAGSDVNVGGDITIERVAGNNQTNACQINMQDACTLDLTGDLLVNYFDAHGNENQDELNMAGGTFNVGGNFTVDMDDGNDFDIDMTGGTLNVTGNFSIDHDGAENIDIFLTGTADFNLTGNFSVDWDGASANDADFDLTMQDDATFDIAGTFDINFNEPTRNSCDLRIDLEDDAVLNMGTAGGGNENVTLTMVDGDITDILLIQDAEFNVLDGDLTISHSGDGNCDVQVNTGQAFTTMFTVSDNMTMTKDDGDLMRLQVQNDGTIDIGGNLIMTASAFDGNNDNLTLQADGDGVIDVDGSVTLTMNSTNNNELHAYFNNNSRFDVGDGDDALTINFTDGDHLQFRLQNNALVNVFGDMNYIYTDGGNGPHFYLNNANNELTITGDLDIDNADTEEIHLRLNNGATLDVDGDIDIQDVLAAGRIRLDNNNSSTIEIGGDFLRNTTAGQQWGTLESDANSTVLYNGAAAQEVAEDAGNDGDSFTYANIEFNNTFGTAPQLTLQGDVTATEGVIFTDGIVDATAGIFIISNAATTTGADDDSHIDGVCRKIGRNPASEYDDGPNADAYEFPVGDDGNYQPIFIQRPGAVTDAFDARYFEVDPDPTYADNLLAGTLDHISSCEYWTLDRTAGSSNVEVGLSWDANSCGVTVETSLRVARWNGAQWNDEGYSTHSGTTAAGVVVSGAAVTTFSPFTLASSTPSNPLPVELISFGAHVNGEFVDLRWQTATEINNDYFTVQRSKDGQIWEDVLTVQGAGNSLSTLTYFDRDAQPLGGVSYYRLKQTDFDGSFTYSNVVPVEITAPGEAAIHIFPNPLPSGENLNLQLTGFSGEEVLVVVRDIQGREFYSKVNVVEQNDQLIAIDVLDQLPAGIYLVIATSNDMLYSKKLIIE